MHKQITLLPILGGKDYPKNVTVEWHGLDTKSLFKENLKKLDQSWFYANNKITYELNSQGYRCKEFDEIDWINSYAVVGCSHIFGSGNRLEDTIPRLIQKKTGVNCINLGVPSSSCEHQFLNTLLLLSYTKVKKVIVVWTYPTRTNVYEKTKFHRLDRLVNKLLISGYDKNFHDKQMLQSLVQLTFGNLEHSVFLLDTYRQIFSNSYKHSVSQFNIIDLEKEFGGHDHYDLNNKLRSPDLARDMQHYGPMWNSLVADKISCTL